MTSLPSDNQPHSSVEVAQATQPSPTMEHYPTTKDMVISSVHLHPSEPWRLSRQDHYTRFGSAQTQPPPHSHNTEHVIRFLPDTSHQSSNPSYPSASPIWRFYSMAAKGLCSKRVEDVKMNRIDKSKSGRRRRPCRRPFVFKSSPLAEGQGAGRFTHFRANSPQPSPSSPPVLACKTPSALHQAALRDRQASVQISRFLFANAPSYPREKPLSISAFNFSAPALSTKQPQISRLRNPRLPPPQSANHYQSWEISLPKCSLPKMGMFAN